MVVKTRRTKSIEEAETAAPSPAAFKYISADAEPAVCIRTEQEAFALIDSFSQKPVPDSVLMRFRESWRSADAATATRGVAYGVVYFNECLKTPSVSSEGMIDSFSLFFRSNFSQVTHKLANLALAALVRYASKFSVSTLCAARIVQVCLTRSENELLLDLVRAPQYKDMVLDTVQEWLDHQIEVAQLVALVAGIAETIDLKEASAFAVTVISKLGFDQYCQFIKQVCEYLSRPAHAVTGLFLLRIISYLALKDLTSPSPSVNAATIADILAQHLPVYKGSACNEKLLPCDLYLRNLDQRGRQRVKPCSNCKDETDRLLDQLDIDSTSESDMKNLGIFSCGNCKNIFSFFCKHCGTCPVSSESMGVVSKLCWGCGYRLIASPAGSSLLMDCEDERIVATCLVLASPHLDKGAKQLFLHHVADYSVSISPMEIGSGEKISPLPLVPSEDFVLSILTKLILKERINVIKSNLVQSLLSTAVPSPNSIKALSRLFPFTLNHQSPLVIEYVSRTLLFSDDNNARLINAVLEFILQVDVSVVDEETLLSFLMENNHKLSISSKKIIFKILSTKTKHPQSAIERLVEYLAVSELDIGDCDALLAEMCKNDEPEIITRILLATAQWPLSESPALQTIPCDSIVGMFFSSSVIRDHEEDVIADRLKALVAYLTATRKRVVSKELSPLMGPLIDLARNARSEKILVIACESISLLLPLFSSSHSLPFSQLVRTKLIPLLSTGSSSAVRACAHLISAAHLHNILNETSIRSLVDVFLPELITQSSSLRACWVLGSLPRSFVDSHIIIDFIKGQPAACLPSLIAVIGFLQDESVLLKEGVIYIFQKGLESFPFKTLQTMINIMEAPPCVKSSLKETRPDGGVRCRSFGDLYPSIHKILETPPPNTHRSLALIALKTLHIMDQLGIVNRRILPPTLFLRYLASNNPDCNESDDDSTEVNAASFRMLTKSFDPKTKIHSILHRVLQLLRPFIPHEGTHTGAVLNTALRFSQIFFSRSLLVKREEMRCALNCIIDHLGKAKTDSNRYFTLFLVLCGIAGCAASPQEDRDSITEKVALQVSLAEEEEEEEDDLPMNSLKFFVSEISMLPKQQRGSIFELLSAALQRFFSSSTTTPRELAQEPPPVPLNRKRRRNTSGIAPLKKRPRKKLNTEYTDGLSDDDCAIDEEFSSSIRPELT